MALVTPAPAPKPKKKPVAKKVIEDDNALDYSHLYSNFYDIFVGQQIDPKSFDLNYAVRETRNIYASFVNLLDSN